MIRLIRTETLRDLQAKADRTVDAELDAVAAGLTSLAYQHMLEDEEKVTTELAASRDAETIRADLAEATAEQHLADWKIVRDELAELLEEMQQLKEKRDRYLATSSRRDRQLYALQDAFRSLTPVICGTGLTDTERVNQVSAVMANNAEHFDPYLAACAYAVHMGALISPARSGKAAAGAAITAAIDTVLAVTSPSHTDPHPSTTSTKEIHR